MCGIVGYIGDKSAVDAQIDAKIAELKQKAVQVTGEPRDVRDLRVAFVEDPSKVRIELVRRPAGK